MLDEIRHLNNSNGELLELLDQYKDMVFKIALNYTKNVVNAEDIFQDVFVKYLKKKPVFNNKEHQKAWFIRVTINLSKNLLNSSWFRKITPLEDDIVFNDDYDSGIFFAVMSLPIKYREVIHLFYYEDYSIKEISQILKIKETTITTRMQRGREQLKNKLEGEIIYEKSVQKSI